MKNANLGQALALERCHLYLAQMCALVYFLTREDSQSLAARDQIYDLIHHIRDELARLGAQAGFCEKSIEG